MLIFVLQVVNHFIRKCKFMECANRKSKDALFEVHVKATRQIREAAHTSVRRDKSQ